MKAPVVCFVDDDPEEIRRFRQAFGSQFQVACGTSLKAAMQEVRSLKAKRPDLFLLDMYFPEHGLPSESELKTLHSARADFLKAQSIFHGVLRELGQTHRGGLSLAQDVRSISKRSALAFFSRKATLEDVLDVYDKLGIVPILKKPDPREPNPIDLQHAYDEALAGSAGGLADHMMRAIRAATLWGRYRDIIIGFCVGVIASMVASGIISLVKAGIGN